MSTFSKGDKVRVIRDTANWSGDQPLKAGEGRTVRGSAPYDASSDGFDVELDNYSFYSSSDLTLARPDVRVGDTIKATRTHPNGDIDVHTGKVVHVSETQVETHHRALWDKRWVIEVIERGMEPLPDTEGSLILATVNGVEGVALSSDGRQWNYISTASSAPKSLITAWVPAKVVAQ